MMRAAQVRVIPGTFISCLMVAELMSTLSSEGGEVCTEGPVCKGCTKATLTSGGTSARNPAAMNTNRIRRLTFLILFFGGTICKRLDREFKKVS